MSRPPRYTAKALNEKIQEYFATCEQKEKRPTVPGLAHYLGYASRQSIWDLKQDERYSYTIKRALLLIESTRNESLITPQQNTAGLIFDLVNNFGWENKQRQEVTGREGGPLEIKIDWPENGTVEDDT